MTAAAQYAEVVSRAADRIERDGLYKGGYYMGWDRFGAEGFHAVGPVICERNLPCCVLGALSAEASVSDLCPVAVAQDVARVLHLEDEYHLPDWNDKRSQRKRRVVAALRRVAQKMNEETK